jgi:hypothetical protein
VVSKKQAVLLEKLGSEPVLVVITERVALSVLLPRRVLRDDIKGQFDDRRQPLVGVLLYISDGIFFFKHLDLLDGGLKLHEK